MTRPAEPVRLAVVPLDELRAIVRDVILEHVGELLEDARRPPALVDRRGLAESLGVGVDTVDRLRREGCPELAVGDSPRFMLADVLGWLKSRDRDR